MFHDEGTSLHDLMYAASPSKPCASGKTARGSAPSSAYPHDHGKVKRDAAMGDVASTVALVSSAHHTSSLESISPVEMASADNDQAATAIATGHARLALGRHPHKGEWSEAKSGGADAGDIPPTTNRPCMMEPSAWWWTLRQAGRGDAQLQDIIRQILLALAAVHAANVTHRSAQLCKLACLLC